jgi:protein TonB
MNATTSYENGGSKITKIAIVTLLHAGVALALLQMRVPPAADGPPPTEVTLVDDAPIVKIDPVTPPDLTPPTTVPPLYVPPTVSTVVNNPAPVLTTTTTMPTTTAEPAGPATIAQPPIPSLPAAPVKAEFRAATAGNCAVPNYPAASARNGDTGTVGLALLIAADGHVADSKVTSSSGFRELDRAALAALSMCKFKPATTNGVPESAWGKIAYVWTLD